MRRYSHCNTCKELSGATYTLNQIIPAKALKITKGDDLGKYTYKGDSGKSVHCVRYSVPILENAYADSPVFGIVLLQELHCARIPPAGGPRPGQHCSEDRTIGAGTQGLQAGRGDLWQGSPAMGEGGCDHFRCSATLIDG